MVNVRRTTASCLGLINESLYYLLTLPVYALAGLLLVITMFLLRLTVAYGTISMELYIFYANVLELSMNTFADFYSNHGFMQCL